MGVRISLSSISFLLYTLQYMNENQPHVPDQKRQDLLSKYESVPYFNSAGARLDSIFAAVEAYQKPDLNDMTVLDLGCGSATEGGRPPMFEAWFPRYCYAHGAKEVIGVDFDPQSPDDKEYYTHLQQDLIRLLNNSEGLSKILPEHQNQIDLINVFGVMIDRPGHNWATQLGHEEEHNTGKFTDEYYQKTAQMREKLKAQAPQLLKPGGILALEDEVYVLSEQGDLKQITP